MGWIYGAKRTGGKGRAASTDSGSKTYDRLCTEHPSLAAEAMRIHRTGKWTLESVAARMFDAVEVGRREAQARMAVNLSERLATGAGPVGVLTAEERAMIAALELTEEQYLQVRDADTEAKADGGLTAQELKLIENLGITREEYTEAAQRIAEDDAAARTESRRITAEWESRK